MATVMLEEGYLELGTTRFSAWTIHIPTGAPMGQAVSPVSPSNHFSPHSLGGGCHHSFPSLARSPSPPIVPSFYVLSHTSLLLQGRSPPQWRRFLIRHSLLPANTDHTCAISASTLPLPNHVLLQRHPRTVSTSASPCTSSSSHYVEGRRWSRSELVEGW